MAHIKNNYQKSKTSLDKDVEKRNTHILLIELIFHFPMSKQILRLVKLTTNVNVDVLCNFTYVIFYASITFYNIP